MVKTALPLHRAPFQSLVGKSHNLAGWDGVNNTADEVYRYLDEYLRHSVPCYYFIHMEDYYRQANDLF